MKICDGTVEVMNDAASQLQGDFKSLERAFRGWSKEYVFFFFSVVLFFLGWSSLILHFCFFWGGALLRVLLGTICYFLCSS